MLTQKPLVRFRRNLSDFFAPLDRWHLVAFGTMCLLALLYASISLVNHYCFRTSALDLGIYNHALFDYSQGRFNYITLLNPKGANVLTDHFAFWPILVSPLRYLFGSYTLLVVQIGFVLLGCWGCFKLVLQMDGRGSVACMSLLFYGTCWGVISALSFDYHDNVLAAMLVPWLFWSAYNQKWLWLSLCFVGILIAKENMPLWLAFLCPAAAMSFAPTPKIRWVLVGMGIFSFIYFVLLIKIVIPNLHVETQDYGHLKYSQLGDSIRHYITTLIKRPEHVFSLLFVSPVPDDFLRHIKTELHWITLLSGGIMLVLRPAFMLMLLPIWGQKLFHDNPTLWGINYHYSIEFVPILTLALFTMRKGSWGQWLEGHQFRRVDGAKLSLLWFACWLCLALFGQCKLLLHRQSIWFSPSNIQFFSPAHYVSSVSRASVKKAEQLILEDAALCANYNLVPHFCNRKKIYEYPDVADAQYILIHNDTTQTYPLHPGPFKEKLNEFLNAPEWTLKFNQENVMLFQRKESQ